MDINNLTDSLEIVWNKQVKKKDNQKYANDINKVFTKYNIQEKINHTHLLRINYPTIDSLILSYFQNRKQDINKLSKIIENYIWISPKKDSYLYHFTTEKNAKSIISSQSLRLYNILKRYDDGEIKDFFKDFKIPYQNTESYEKIFYSSFTNKIPTSDANIQQFRNFTGSYGARLKFKIIKSYNEIKFITYDAKKFEIIHDLRDTIKKNYNIELIINGFTTRFAAHYVNEKFVYENEVRLYKNLIFESNISIKQDKNNFNYIDIDLSNNNLLKLEEVIFERDKEIFI